MRRAAAEWRAAARLARREVRRRPGRMVLVLVLIGLPVAGLTLYTVGARTTTPSVTEQRTALLGQADDVVSEFGPQVDRATFEAAIAPAYPDGSRFVSFGAMLDAVTNSDGHLADVDVSERPLDDRLLSGTMPLVEGRAPREDGEVAIDLKVAALADADIGSTVDLLLLGRRTVTGIVANPRCAHTCPTVVTTGLPTDRPVDRWQAFVDTPGRFVGAYLGPLPPTAESLVGPGRRYSLDESELRRRQAAVYLIGAGVLAAATVIAMGAFAVSTRRQLRLLGTLGASGVPPVGLRRVVLLQGTTAGAIGSAAGVLLGLLLARVLFPYFDDVSNEYVRHLDVHPLDLVGPFVLGTLAATIAGWLPARTAARTSTLAALAGRPAYVRPPGWHPVVGLLAIGGGVVVAAGLVVAPLAAPVGLALLAGLAVLGGGLTLGAWLVSRVEPLAGLLRGGARVAVRDLARQRLRSGAVVASIMAPAGVLVVVLIASATNVDNARTARDALRRAEPVMNGIGYDKVLLNPPGGWATGERPPAEELGAIRRILPDAVEEDVHVVLPQQPSSTGFPGATLRTVVPANGHVLDDGLSGAGRQLVTVDPAVVAQTGAPAAVVDALEEGKVVIFGGAPASGPKEYRLDGLTVPFDSTDVVVFALRVPRYSQIAAISPATAEAWGAQTLYYGTLFDAPADLTSSQRRRLEQFGDEACSGDDVDSADCHDAIIRTNLLGPGVDGATTPFWSPEIGFVPTPRPPGNLVRYGYAGILLAFTLLVVAIALALSAAESRDERALLAAIGAPPSIRRSTAAWQAGLLPGIAMLVAVPGGIAVAPLMVSGVGLSTIPWLHLAAVAVGIPLASATAAWLGTAITTHRRSIRPRDLSPLALAVD